MQPAIDPTISAASKNRSEISIPCAPRGGTVNLDRSVTATSGVASTAKRSRSTCVDSRGSAAALSSRDGSVLPVAFTIAGEGVMSRSLVDHGAEQHRSGRLELRLDANRVGQPGAMAFGREHYASRTGCDDLCIGALEHRRGVDDYNVVFGRRGLHQITEGNVTEQFLRVGRRRAGAHHPQAAE